MTDYRPGIDFANVRVDVLDETVHTRPVGREETFLEPGDVARFEALARATRRRVQVSLFDANGMLLQRSRTVSFQHEHPRQQVTRICAACEDFACPLGQTCECGVSPECVPDECDDEACEVPLRCNSNLDCGSGPAPCLSLSCESGACLRVPDDTACDETYVCDVGSGCVPSGAQGLGARQIAPLSTSTVTSQRPTLRWALSGASEGARVELCRDRAMTAGCLAPLDAMGTEVRPPSDLAPGWWFFRLRANVGGVLEPPGPVWQFRVGSRSADGDVDTSWGTEPDVNGDGFADLVVGSPDAVVASTRVGTVDVFLGLSSGLEMSPSESLVGTVQRGDFGFTVACAGDVNGDGFVDVIVGAPGAGTVSLYLGSPAGLAGSPLVVLPGASGDDFGTAIAGAGDVNGDGYADVLVGAPRASPGGRLNAGMVTLYLGSPGGLIATPARELQGEIASDRFGTSVASAGDINGDGYADVLVGTSQGGTFRSGNVSVYMGSTSGIAAVPTHVLDGMGSLEEFGVSVAGAGDLNGDGYADLVVGAPSAAALDSRAFVYLGSETGPPPTPTVTLVGPTGLVPEFGASVASAGDLDSDGYADVLVGAPRSNGEVRIFLGSPTGVTSSPDQTHMGVRLNGSFGRLVAGIGDTDGDGHADIAVSGRASGGRWAVHVFPGSPTEVTDAPTVREGLTLSDRFGWSLARGH